MNVRRPPGLRGAAAALLLVALGAAGCSDPAPEATEATPAPPAAAEDDGEETEDATGGSGDCDADLDRELDTLVGDQLNAFVADDWEGALAFASPGFAAQFDPDTFAQVIEQSFPVVADAASHTSSGCTVGTDGPAPVASLDVLVTSRSGADLSLRYAFVRTDGRWGIAGAVPTADPGNDALTTV